MFRNQSESSLVQTTVCRCLWSSSFGRRRQVSFRDKGQKNLGRRPQSLQAEGVLKHQSAHGRWRVSSWSQNSSLLPIVRSDIAGPVSALLWNVQFGELAQHMLPCFPGLSSNDPLPWFRVCICSPRLHKTVSANYVSANRAKSQTPDGLLNIFSKAFWRCQFFFIHQFDMDRLVIWRIGKVLQPAPPSKVRSYSALIKTTFRR